MAFLRCFLVFLGFLLVFAAATAPPLPQSLDVETAMGEREDGVRRLLAGFSLVKALPRVEPEGRAAIGKILEMMGPNFSKSFKEGIKAGKTTREIVESSAHSGCLSFNNGCCGNGSANQTQGISWCTSVCQACRTAHDVYCKPANRTTLPPSKACSLWAPNYANWTQCAQLYYHGCLARNNSISLSTWVQSP